MNKDEVIDFINSSLANGLSKEDIYKNLISQGLNVDDIQYGFKSLNVINKKEDFHTRTISIVLGIGAILIGAGIFSFIASNWIDIPKLLRVLIILIAIISFYSSGWYVREYKKIPVLGDALILLGSIMYGYGIFLVGQTFSIRANWPDGLALWLLGIIILAHVLESYKIFYLSIIIGIVAVFSYLSVFEFQYNSFMLVSFLILVVTSVATFSIGSSMRSKLLSEIDNF